MAPKLPSEKSIEHGQKIFEAHAAGIGHIALEWNALNDALGELFIGIIDPGCGRAVLFAAWQSIPSDRNKRQMLERAAFAKLGANDRLYKEIKWLCGELNSQEDKRNDAVHTPFSVSMEEGGFKVVPVLWTGNPRAQKLRDKDIALELKSYRANINSLKQFAYRLAAFPKFAAWGEAAWPNRPSLPRPAQAKADKS